MCGTFVCASTDAHSTWFTQKAIPIWVALCVCAGICERKKKLSWQNWPCMKSLRACRLWHQNPNGWRNVCVKCRRHRSILTWAKANRTEHRFYTNENRYESQMTYPPHACMLIASRESSGNRTHTQNTNVQRTQQHRLVKSSCSEQLK